jgi:hypothetical protein
MLSSIVQAYEGELPDLLAECIASVYDSRYEKIFLDAFPDRIDRSKGLRNASDIFRIEWLIQNPYYIWIDCDVKQGKDGFPDLEDNGKPWFSQVFGIPDIWVIAPMGNIKLIESLYGEVKKSDRLIGPEFCRLLHREEINLIPINYFHHLENHLTRGQANERSNSETIR